MTKTKSTIPAKIPQGSGLADFFIGQLKDIYWAEKHLTRTLPKMQKAATTTELKIAFKDHLAVTQNQVIMLERAFGMMGRKALARKCEAMEGITKEGSRIIEQTPLGTITRDAGLIISAQKVEHYEIATYGSLVQLSKTLGLESITGILEQILIEEKEADLALSDLAINSITAERINVNVVSDEENE